MFDLSIPPLVQIPATALASAYLTSYFQNRDHRYRKHWEMKVQAYRDLIDALSGIEQYYDAHLRSVTSSYEIDPETQKGLEERLTTCAAEVRRAALTGAFLFSADVEAALNDYLKDRPREHDWFSHVLDEGAAVAACRRQVVMLAAHDLELAAPLFYRVRRMAARVSKRLRISFWR